MIQKNKTKNILKRMIIFIRIDSYIYCIYGEWEYMYNYTYIFIQINLYKNI